MSIRTVLIHSLLTLSLLPLLAGAGLAANNTILGTGAGVNLTGDADGNTLIGENAGNTITDGDSNTLVGAFAGEKTNACCNTLVGARAGLLVTGQGNSFFGDVAGRDTTTGRDNSFFGAGAGLLNNGDANVFVGVNAGFNEMGSHKLYIANTNTTTPLIYGEFNNGFVGINGALGVGTTVLMDKLHVKNGNLRIEQTAANAVLNFIAGSNTWRITQNLITGRLVFFSPGGGASTASFKFDRQATENLFRVGVLGPSTVDVKGDLFVDGDLLVTGTITPDYVFSPEYALESIDAHAAYMWQHRHLPAVGPGQVNAGGQGMINVGHRSQGMLEELEKAHIYIEQLHGEMTQNEEEVAVLKGEVTALKAKEAELETLKSQMTEKETQMDTLQGEVATLKALVNQLMTRDQDAAPEKEG